MTSTTSSFFSKIKSIKMPVFQLIFYSSAGYLGYIFYQDYHYKQLVKQIAAHSSKQTQIDPLRRISQIVTKISEVEGKRQLKFLLKDLESNVEKYWIDPRKGQDLLDFEMKELQKPEEDKKLWWVKPYITVAKLYTSIYHRANIKKEGTFGLFFWSNYTVEEKNYLLECKSLRALVEKAVKVRGKKCQDFAINRKDQGFQKEDREIWECLNQTSREVSSLKKMMQRVSIIEYSQSSK